MTIKQRRGFASMNPVMQREIASSGGRSAQARGTAHQWTSEGAALAGRKGGLLAQQRRREAREALAGNENSGSSRFDQ
jgi:hypothetical protein